MAGRASQTINSNWSFYKGAVESIADLDKPDIKWEQVNLPHSYNKTDVVDEIRGYYRGETWYKKSLFIPASSVGKQSYLFFDGVNQETEVYVNGKKAGSHLGGYTRFVVPLNGLLTYGQNNTILVMVNNRFNKEIPTLAADFTFYGGIYRDVYLVETESVHFALNHYASEGLFVSTPQVSKESASLHVRAEGNSEADKPQNIVLEYTLQDANGNIVKSVAKKLKLKAGEAFKNEVDITDIKSPKLWSPSHPYLYNVSCVIRDAKSGTELDRQTTSMGFRWYKFTPDQGFFINGEPLKLIGTNRHQDYKGLANALPEALHINDIHMLKNMGGNFLRIAHYPQDRTILETCDKLGIITSVEIPIVNYITENEGFYHNCREMMKEMIFQNYNHPSVVIWAYMNEVLVSIQHNSEPELKKQYLKNVAMLARQLDSIARAEDKERYTMMPNHGDLDLYKRTGLTAIPMIVGWNIYDGWYGERMNNFEKFLDRHRAELPDKPVIITEYGAGIDPRINTANPMRYDFSGQYGLLYHKHYLDEMQKRPFVSGSNVWNFADFTSEGRVDATPNVNNKGLVTLDRRPKDVYYFYQACLVKEPVVKIGSKISSYASGLADANGTTSTQTIQVFTNQEKVNLSINGVSLGEKSAVDHIIEWQVPFVEGENSLEATASVNGKIIKDVYTPQFHVQPNVTTGFLSTDELRVNVGSYLSFVDDLTHETYIPSKEYTKGSWGTVGGEMYKTNGGKFVGSFQPIYGTENEPLYQSQIVGLEAFKADVPQGTYELTLSFAELTSSKEREKLAYDLGLNKNDNPSVGKRIFNVWINNQLVIEGLNIAEQFGEKTAVDFKIPVSVNNLEGLIVRFESVTGKPVLNVLKLRRRF
jgi:beta-galactosidase